MKTQQISTVFAALCLVMASLGCSYLGVGTPNNPVDQLVSLCKNDKFKEAAKYMKYIGTDPARKDTATNYETGDEKEKRYVEGTCKRYKAMAETPFTVTPFAVRPEQTEQGFQVYEVEFKEGRKTIKKLWAFKKSGTDLVLIDVD